MRSPITLVALFLLLSYHTASARQATTPNADFKTSANTFVENKGQIVDQYGNHRTDIDFKLNAGGMSMFIGNGQLHYQWYKTNSQAKTQNSKEEVTNEPTNPIERRMHDSPFEGGKGDVNAQTDIYRLDVELVGANTKAQMQTEEPAAYYENYYLPQCPDGATAYSYGKVIYKNIYPNIDWVIYTMSPSGEAKGEAVKYDFIVHHGGNPADIKLAYKGATSLTMNDGALTAATPLGSITEQKPYSYIAGTKQEVNSSFVLKEGVLSFNVGKYEGTLVIDPALVWGTYYGLDGPFYYGMCTDSSSNVYYLSSLSVYAANITTTGAHQTVFGGDIHDALITKFDSTGNRVWCTYYGGNGSDGLLDIVYDFNNNAIYTCGGTNSTNGIATSGTHMSIPPPIKINHLLAMLVKFSTSGIRQWGTYYGGDTLYTSAQAVCTDGTGNVYIAGITTATSGIATTGAFNTTLMSGSMEGFLAKFNGNNGTRLWGTYYGGANDDEITDATCDQVGNVYIAGKTASTSGIASSGSHQSAYASAYDGFIAKFNGTGSRLWGTYYGGAGSEEVTAIISDYNGNVYCAGYTSSSSGISTSGTYQPVLNGSSDGFITKFNSSGVRQWATYYGGNGSDIISSLTGTATGHICAAGWTNSTSGIAKGNVHQSTLAGGVDAYVCALSPNGTTCYWGTYFGGTEEDQVNCVSSNRYIERLFISGYTKSTSGIATTGAYKPTSSLTSNSSDYERYLAAFTFDTSVYILPTFSDTVFCISDTLHLPYSVTRNYRSTNVFTVQLSNASGSFASPVNIGSITSPAAGVIHCPLSTSIPPGLGYRVRIIASAPADTSEDNGLDIKIRAYPSKPVAVSNDPCSGNTLTLNAGNNVSGVVWAWSGPNSFSSAIQNPVITNAQTINSGTYIVTADLNGCAMKDTVVVTVYQTPAKPIVSSNSPLCSGFALNLSAATSPSGVSWNWAGPNSWSSTQQNPVKTNAQITDSGYYIATAILGPCSTSDSTYVIVNPSPAISIYANPNDSICAGSSITLVALPSNSGVNPQYQWYRNSSAIAGATGVTYTLNPSTGDVFYCRLTPGVNTGCSSGNINSIPISMTVLPYLTPSISIMANPATPLSPWQMVSFTATAVNGGASPQYQWKRNGVDIQGATAQYWSANNLSDKDTICCVLTSSYFCPQPATATSNCIVVDVLTGVENIQDNKLKIYPNPVNDRLIIEGAAINSVIQVFDVLGREVLRDKIRAEKHSMSTSGLSTGTYILQLTNEQGKTVYKISKE